MKRLLGYLKPHKWVMLAATVLVLFIIVVELYRPIIIGDAIDDYINGYYEPYVESDAGETVYNGMRLARRGGEFSEEELSSGERKYYQLLLYEDSYYMAEGLTAAESQMLIDAEPEVVKEFIDGYSSGVPLEREELKVIRRPDFHGILRAAALYLAVMAAGFLLNWASTTVRGPTGMYRSIAPPSPSETYQASSARASARALAASASAAAGVGSGTMPT